MSALGMSDMASRAAALLQAEWRRPRTLSPWLERAAFMALLLVAGVLRVATIETDSLWIDEGYTLASAGHSFWHIFTVPFDSHPPLHFAIVKLFTLFLSGEWAVRLPSALFSLATLVPAYLLARRLMGPVGAMVACATLAFSYTLLVQANNGRDYAQLQFFFVLAAWCLQALSERLTQDRKLFDRASLGWSAAYAFAALGALYSHNTGIMYLFTLNAVVCAWLLALAPRKAPGRILVVAAANALPLLAWLPWLRVVMGTSDVFDWLQQMGPVEAVVTLAATVGPNATPAPLMGAFFIALFAGCGLSLLRPGWSAVHIIVNLVAFPALIWLLGYVYKPIYMERIILPAMLGGALAIGYLAAHGRRTWLAAGLSGLAILISAVSAAAYELRGNDEASLGAHLVQDWRGAISAQAEAGETLIICDTFSWPVVHHYAGPRRVWVNQDKGVWHLTEREWLEHYGKPVAERMAEAGEDLIDWKDRAHIDWDAAVAQAPSLVFLKPDVLCNDGEPEALRARLAAAGYRQESQMHWSGVSAERYVR